MNLLGAVGLIALTLNKSQIQSKPHFQAHR
jgi:hypothetical protein